MGTRRLTVFALVLAVYATTLMAQGLGVRGIAPSVYVEKFDVNGPPPREYQPVGGASLMVSGGQLIVQNNTGTLAGFQLTYPLDVDGQPLEVFCTEFEIDVPAMLAAGGDTVVMTFSDGPALRGQTKGPGDIELTVTENADGTYFLRIRKDGKDKYRQDRVFLPAGFVKYRFDKVGGNTVVLERVRADGTFEEVLRQDPPGKDVPFESVTVTSNVEEFAIGSVVAGPHQDTNEVEPQEPPIGLGLVLAPALLMLAGRRRLVWVLMLGCLLLLVTGASHAQTTTATTPTIDLGTAQAGTPLAGVTVTKSLTVNGANDTAMTECTFSNSNMGAGGARTFAFCSMIGVRTGEAKPVAASTCCVIERDPADANNLRCRTFPCGGKMLQPSYHFGCTVVSVPAGGTATTPPSVSPPVPGFDGHDASDFDVLYADVIDLTGGLTFDNNNTCSMQGCFGTNSWTDIAGALAPIAAGWVGRNVHFKDPYYRYEKSAITYATFVEGPCVPDEFPYQVTELPLCPPPPGAPPDFIAQDINLFDWRSMGATEPVPAFLTVEVVDGFAPPGVIIETTPAEGEIFNLEGGEETFGTLGVHSPPDLAEGSKMTVQVTVYEAESGQPRFAQTTTFIHDTVPPSTKVTQLAFDADGFLDARVEASDPTTGAINATFWYSVDGGDTWEYELMDSEQSVFEDLVTRDFRIKAGPFAPGTAVDLFFSAQDTLENITYFGAGTHMVNATPAVCFDDARCEPKP